MKSVTLTAFPSLASCLPLRVLTHPFTNPETSLRRKQKCQNGGSSALRYALMNAAHNIVKYNQTFKEYYDSKRAEGRGHYNALGHCVGKLVRIIYKMLKDDVEFNLD